jgi:hypothetical protein
LDQLLFDLKYDPSAIEIPVPRYFKEKDDNLKVKLMFKEEVERAGGKKKKKGGRKKKGKKKKDKDEKPIPKMTLSEQVKIIAAGYKDVLDIEPDIVEEKVHDIFAIDMDIDIAIRVIQNNERGRQGISRIHQIKKIIRDQKKEKDMQKAIKRGGGRMAEG